MRLLIHDANVLMDLLEIHLLERALDLPYEMETTDIVRLEITDSGQAEILEACIDSRIRGEVLTGDGRLRKEAASRKLEVHGTLWILRRMVEVGGLPKAEAIAALEALMISNPRLPEKDCSELLKSWKGT